MKRNQKIPILIATSFLFLASWCANNALASVTLTNIPLYSGFTVNEARAVSPDGKWVVGFNGYSSTFRDGQGYLYDAVTNTVYGYIVVGSVGGSMTGVAYRNYNGTNQLIFSGFNAGWNADYMTADGGATFGTKRRDTNLGNRTDIPSANALAGTETDVFYGTFLSSSGSLYTNYVNRLSGNWPANAPRDADPNAGAITTAMNGISATGRAVGWQNSVRVNYVLDWTGTGTATAWYFNGLDGTTAGEAFAVSANGGTIFGQSPSSDPFTRPGNWPYKATFDAAMPGPATLLGVNELPSFPDTVGATGNAGVPYGCTADGKYAVGMSYRGVERAVLWDTSDPSPLKWQVVDLTELAKAHANLDIFVSLNRAYSVTMNAAGSVVIVGAGTDTSLSTRAFYMTVSPPIPPVGYPPVVTISGSYPAGFNFTFLSAPTNIFNDLGYPNLTNYLEYTTDITPPSTWNTITSNECNGAITALSDPSPAGRQRFYRIHTY